MKPLYLFFLLIFSITLSAQNFKLIDDLGNSIFFDGNPNRVISLAPNITEMIYQIGVENHLVGNTKFCNYPDEANSVLKIGDMLSINFEKIIELKPDLIFITVEGNQKNAYDKLLDLGYKVFVSNPRDFNGIKKTFNDIGQIFGKQHVVNNHIEKWDSTLNNIQTEAQKLSPQSIMILVEINPIMVAGKNTFINTYIETCNMKNFAEEMTLNYPPYSREVVVESDPDIIVYPSSGKETIETLTDLYPEWEKLSAIKNNKVFFVDRDLYFRPGPRFIEALADFYSRLVNTFAIE